MSSMPAEARARRATVGVVARLACVCAMRSDVWKTLLPETPVKPAEMSLLVRRTSAVDW